MIQIDMEMPSCCYDCDFSIGVMSTKADRECTITDKYVNDDDKPEWCPLIDVPDNNVGNSSEIPNRSTDCISRQAAIDAITVRADRCAENFSTDDPFWEGLVIAESIVKGLPPVQAATPVRPERKESDWIPCSDRPPEKEGRYLITVDEGDRKDVSDDFFYFREDGVPSWYVEKNVIAWMPFPEPYRGEQDA